MKMLYLDISYLVSKNLLKFIKPKLRIRKCVIDKEIVIISHTVN